MRTTVSISDELLAAAKRLARERGQTLRALSEAWTRAISSIGSVDRSLSSTSTWSLPRHTMLVGEERFTVPVLVWASFLRLATTAGSS